MDYALLQVAHVNHQKEQYVLLAECNKRDVCQDLARAFELLHLEKSACTHIGVW